MESPSFHFNDAQRKELCDCWKRPREREIALLYLQEVELLIADWQDKNNRNPPTTIKEQIALAKDLQINVQNKPLLLEQLPRDFEKLLATVWLKHKYGESYFQQHSEACRKDAANNIARRLMIEAALRGLAPESAPKPAPIQTEFSKLPPDYFQQTKTDADFLRIVASAAGEIAWMLREAKQWHNKSAEEDLLFSLALSYEHHFGKLPSAANEGKEGYASPFRSLLANLAKILSEQPPNFCKYKFGADMTRAVLRALTR